MDKEAVGMQAITVWKDGRYKFWSAADAAYAQNDPDWLATIPLTQPPAKQADDDDEDAPQVLIEWGKFPGWLIDHIRALLAAPAAGTFAEAYEQECQRIAAEGIAYWKRKYEELHAATVAQGLTAAARDVLAERQRQIEAEGWTPEHDDQHREGEMAEAAAAYASESAAPHGGLPMCWPWAKEWWKPAYPRRNLVKAGALILAEIERLDRAAQKKGA